jgi:hypothetical protein
VQKIVPDVLVLLRRRLLFDDISPLIKEALEGVGPDRLAPTGSSLKLAIQVLSEP